MPTPSPIKTLILLSALLYVITLSTFAQTPDSIQSKTLLLTEKPWKYTSALETKNANGQWVKKSDTFSDCKKDDTLTFKMNGTYKIFSGQIKCSAEEDLYNSGNWQLLENGKTLKLDGYILQVIVLTESTLQLINNTGEHEERLTLIREKE